MFNYLRVILSSSLCFFKKASRLPSLYIFLFLLFIGTDLSIACDPNVDPSCATFWNAQSAMADTSWFSLKIIYMCSAVIGVFLVCSALMSLKSIGEQGGQNHHKRCIILFVLGGCMISLPFIGSVSQNSFLQSGISTGGSSGALAFNVPTESEAYTTSGAPENWASNNPDDH